MRLVEGLLLLLTAAWPVLRLLGWHQRRRVATAFVVASVIAITLLFVAGASRWPAIPALLLLLVWEILATGIMVGDIPLPDNAGRVRHGYGAVLALGVLPAVALPLVLLPRVPGIIADGPFLVGARDLIMIDSTRVDEGGALRQVPIRFWYPGEPEADLRAVGPGRDLESLEAALALTLSGTRAGWAVRGVTRTPLEAYAPMRLATAQRAFPVVVISHGMPGSSVLLRRMAVALASHGYVVVAPEHAGGRWNGIADGAGTASRSLDPPADALTPWFPVWEADASFVLVALQRLAAPGSGDLFAGRLLVAQVGWVGQGIGAEAGRSVTRGGGISALVALDPIGGAGLPVEHLPELRMEREGLPTVAGSQMIRTAMIGAGAADFSDLARWSPLLLRQAGLGGRIPAERMEEWIREWVTAFLDRHLREGSGDDLLDLASRFPGTSVSLP